MNAYNARSYRACGTGHYLKGTVMLVEFIWLCQSPMNSVAMIYCTLYILYLEFTLTLCTVTQFLRPLDTEGDYGGLVRSWKTMIMQYIPGYLYPFYSTHPLRVISCGATSSPWRCRSAWSESVHCHDTSPGLQFSRPCISKKVHS